MAKLEDDNAVRWKRGDTGGHVESFFLKANHRESDRAFWLKFTLYIPVGGEGAVGEVWAILFDGEAGHLAAKATYPVSDVTLRSGGVGLRVGGCSLAPGETRGELAAADGTMFRWDLRFDGARAPLRPFPFDWMYTASLPKSKSLTPSSDASYDGFVEAGDRRYEVAGWPGMQGHNWGKNHAERYAWAHCNVFEDPEGQPVDAVFEGFSAKVKLGPVVTPFLTIAMLSFRGRLLAFNRPLEWLRATTEVTYTGWTFSVRRGEHRLHGRLWTPAEQMVGLTYYNPTGDYTHCLNSKIASAELVLSRGEETLARLFSPRKAALEVTVREPDHPVKMVL